MASGLVSSVKRESCDGWTCQICLSSASPTEISTLPCGHSLCHGCAIKFFLRREFSCPTCRTEIDFNRFNDPELSNFCRVAQKSVICFRCEKASDPENSVWCSECASLYCNSCSNIPSDPESVSKSDTHHVISHQMCPWSVSFGVDLCSTLWNVMLRQVQFAEATEPQRLDNVAQVFHRRLHPRIMAEMGKKFEQTYFVQEAAVFRCGIEAYCRESKMGLHKHLSLLKALYGDNQVQDCLALQSVLQTDWTKIIKSANKLNTLLKSIYGFEDARSESLKDLFWAKNPRYFDSSHWDGVEKLPDKEFDRFAKNFSDFATLDVPNYGFFIYDEILKKGINGLSVLGTGGNEEKAQPPSSPPPPPPPHPPSSSSHSPDRTEHHGLSRLKNFFLGSKKKESKHSEGGAGPGPTSSAVSYESAVAATSQRLAAAAVGEVVAQRSSTEMPEPRNEDGDHLTFFGSPLDAGGRKMGICEPVVMPDGRILVCNQIAGIYIFDEDMEMIDLVRKTRSYCDLKHSPSKHLLITLGGPRKKNCGRGSDVVELEVMDLEFHPVACWILPEYLAGVRCLAPTEECLFLMDDRKIHKIYWSTILPGEPESKKWEERSVVGVPLLESGFETIVEQTAEDVLFGTFFAYEENLYVSSHIQNEILVMNSSSGKITKRIHSSIFERPIRPSAICSDEFGNLLVKDIGGLIAFDIKTGAFKGVIIDMQCQAESGEITAKNGWVYHTSSKSLILRIHYLKPELASQKSTEGYYRREKEPECKN